jgi:hypothetical protein
MQAMRLIHDQHLQGLVVPMKLLEHEQLLDPEEWGLRGTSLGCEAGREAGLQHEREGRSAGSLSYTPSLALLLQHWGRRVLATHLQSLGRAV